MRSHEEQNLKRYFDQKAARGREPTKKNHRIGLALSLFEKIGGGLPSLWYYAHRCENSNGSAAPPRLFRAVRKSDSSSIPVVQAYQEVSGMESHCLKSSVSSAAEGFASRLCLRHLQ